MDEDDQEDTFEVDLNENEPKFLSGQSSHSGLEMSPIKIVKNPDGSLQRAAMTQVNHPVLNTWMLCRSCELARFQGCIQ